MLRYSILFFFFSFIVLSLGNGWYLSVGGLNANFLMLFFILLLFFVIGKINYLDKNIVYILWIIFFIYNYGILLGIISGYEIYNVIRNSFGLLFFLSLILIYILRPSIKNIINIFLISSVVVLIETILIYLDIVGINLLTGIDFQDIAISYSYGVIGGGEYGVRAFMTNQTVLFPLIAMLLFSKNFLLNIIGLILFLVLFGLTFSRAYILSFTFILFFVFLLRLLQKDRKIFLILIFLFIGFLILFTVDEKFSTAIISIIDFSGENQSNLPRVEQFNWFLDYIDSNPVIGYGFGAYMPEYIRSNTNVYSYELQYIDLYFKLGFLSLALIFIYFLPLILALKKFNVFDKELHIIIGIISINLTSIGNPYLFAQQNIYMVSLAYYIVLILNTNKKVY